MTVQVKVRLLGIFRGLSKRDQLVLRWKKPVSVREVIKRIAAVSPPEFGKVLIDPELEDPRPNALILVNGEEINILEGLETRVNGKNEIVLIPVSHGG
jgi:molybdopterin converting factor small subunit